MPTQTPTSVDHYYFNIAGIESGRCDDGPNSQIYDLDECKFAVENLGYEVKTSCTVNAKDKACGCAYSPITGRVQFNEIGIEYCYETAEGKHVENMPLQDENAEEEGLVNVCYKKPGIDEGHPGVRRGNNYLNLAGIGSGRCDRDHDDLITTLEGCQAAVESLGYEVKTIYILTSAEAVCGCSLNTETGHIQVNYVKDTWCYDYELGKMEAQDRNSREERLIAVCHHDETPTAEPTMIPTAKPSAIPTTVPSATPTTIPSATPTATPSAAPTAVPSTTPTASPSATPTTVPSATPSATPSAVPTAAPSAIPSATPTATPSATPTATPPASPSAVPSMSSI